MASADQQFRLVNRLVNRLANRFVNQLPSRVSSTVAVVPRVGETGKEMVIALNYNLVARASYDVK